MRMVIAAFLLATLPACVWGEPPAIRPTGEVCSHIKDVEDRQLCEQKVLALADSDRTAARSGVPLRSAIPLSGLLSWWAIYYAFGIFIGRTVMRDARRREWLVLRIRPIWWAVFCVFNPVLGVLAYWAMHYSRLAPRFPASNDTPE